LFKKSNDVRFKERSRISEPVVLRVKLEAVSRPGVMFSDCNATRHDATFSSRPDIVRFEFVKAENAFRVPELLRRFYQAEVLVLLFPKRRTKESDFFFAKGIPSGSVRHRLFSSYSSRSPAQ
jgi:hypothetical protein